MKSTFDELTFSVLHNRGSAPCNWPQIESLCCGQEHLPLTSQSMADSFKSQTWPVLTFSETRQWSFFLSPTSFHSFYPWLRLRALRRTFFTLGLSTQMNPLCLKTCSPAVQTQRGAGNSVEKLDPDDRGTFLHALVKCGVSTPRKICQEASIQAHHACTVGS